MELHELSFAKIILLREDIAEVIINDWVEMNVAMVDEYHQFLLAHLKPPFSLLINKVNSYSYDFEAQEKLATLKEINAMAVVAYRRSTEVTTQALASMPRTNPWEMRIFSDREPALAWLTEKQDYVQPS